VCRLWHQLTQKVDEFFDHTLAKPYRVDVFTRFVRDFEERLNPLRLAEMGIKISQDIDSPLFLLPPLIVLLTDSFRARRPRSTP
jgi:26S proteasome regulatory subunit N9